MKSAHVWIPAVLVLVYLIHGSLLGLTDDEAYYWVLAQRPALGYAFHPPGVAWSIAVFQWLLSPLFGVAESGLVRLPAALFSGGMLALALRWIRFAGGQRLGLGGMTILSFAGVFGASWMMVPDLPLFFSWMLAFTVTWRLCSQARVLDYWLLAFAAALSMLSKYSAVLALGSSGLALLLWSSRPVFWRGAAALILGATMGVIPTLIWNAQHEWASLLYQISDRHGGSLSWARYARFWLIQAFLAGPPLLYYSLTFWKRFPGWKLTVPTYALIWGAPAGLVFLTQPLFADFKPHWTFIVWLPFVLEWAWRVSREGLSRLSRFQIGYGLSLSLVALVFCHFPVTSQLISTIRGGDPDPRWDVTNDMYGWSELRAHLQSVDPELLKLPMVGSRYQTASQAAFSIGDSQRVALLPRDLKQRDEWPILSIAETTGPSWPVLTQPVLFVADNRYSSRPKFRMARCEKLPSLRAHRGNYLAKRIDLWKCSPLRASR